VPIEQDLIGEESLTTLSPGFSPYPTDESGRRVTGLSISDDDALILPTDALGREIHPVMFFNRTRLPTDDDHHPYDPVFIFQRKSL
jgi:hypothetical protein